MAAPWLYWALASAFFAALTAIFAKAGLQGIDSDFATFIRTLVIIAALVLFLSYTGKWQGIGSFSAKNWIFLVLSGLATGASWLCYYYSIQTGVVSIVVPIDKLSLLGTVFFSYLVFKEKLTKKSFTGLVLITVATLAMTIWH